MAEIFHLTCRHKADGIRADGMLVMPQPQPVLGNRELSWFTHVPDAPAVALGLTMLTLKCDRTERRFRVVDLSKLYYWNDVRSRMPVFGTQMLEAGKGTRPAYWWIATEPVLVEEVD